MFKTKTLLVFLEIVGQSVWNQRVGDLNLRSIMYFYKVFFIADSNIFIFEIFIIQY